jgi:SAM-dependent methyltransferase
MRRRFDARMTRTLGDHYVKVDPGRAPPRKLVQFTSAMDQKALDRESNPDRYFLGGYRRLVDWLTVLEHFSFNLRTAEAILEFGCGTARLLRHLRGFDGVRLVGTDANPKVVEWCRRNVPGPEFHRNDLQPPLSFAADESFDLILASSVFTHIPIDRQRAWLEELRRVLKPGGYFLCTVVGPKHQAVQLGRQEMAALRSEGHVTFESDDARASLSTRLGGSRWDVFQRRDQVVASFGSVFRILDYITGAQDLLVLHKPDPSKPLNVRPFPFQGLF